MKKLIVLTLICVVCFTKMKAQCFVDTATLNQSYKELIRNPKTYEREKKFFDSFPSSWVEYILTYQYYPGRLYFLDDKQVETFGNLTLIPDSIYCDKLINLTIGGKWVADYPSALQDMLHRIMGKKTDVFFARLSKQSQGYQLRFWLFFWSSQLYPEDGGSLREDYPEECEHLKSKMKVKYPDVVEIMEIALPFALGEIRWNKFDELFPHQYFKN